MFVTLIVVFSAVILLLFLSSIEHDEEARRVARARLAYDTRRKARLSA
jgi:hypothetical protein